MTRPASYALALLLAASVPAVAATTAAHTPSPKPKLPAVHTMAPRPIPGKTVTLPDGLKYTDIVVGKGPVPGAGQTAVVHYTGTFPDGKKFDSSRDRGQPFEFVLGGHQVIACWDEGVASMHVGGRRKLVCPPALAYGERGAGGGVIPPNATLNFDVELLGVK
jgi:peptidylprolyl isomerase